MPFSSALRFRCLAVLCVALLASPAGALGQALTSADRPVRFGITPIVQRFSDDGISSWQAATAVDVRVPFGTRWEARASIRGARAETDGRLAEPVMGLDDAALGVLYAQPWGDASLVARVDASLPTGKQELTLRELQTVRRISNSVYGYRVPGFGTGFGVAPSLTVAFPVGDRVALGVGSSFRFLGSYQPIAGMDGSYRPGNGLEGFMGLDVAVSETVSLALDGRYVRYQTDRVNGVDRLASGDLLSGSVQMTVEAGFQRVAVSAGYVNWAESEFFPLVAGGAGTSRRQQLSPSEGRAALRYRARVARGTFLAAHASGHLYTATVAGTETQRVARFGLSPSIRLTDALHLMPTAIGTVGTFTGFEAALRTEVRW